MKKITDKTKFTQEESLALFTKPVNSQTNPRSMFVQEVAYQNIEPYPLVPLQNFTYENMMYGKLNTNNSVIVPNPRFLREIPNIPPGQYTFSFIVDAYLDFFSDWNLKITRNVVQDSNEFNYIPVKSYSNFENEYKLKFNEYYNLFDQYLTNFNLTNEITDFKSFLKYFSIYISLSSLVSSFTLSNFIRSKNCSPHVTGLVLSVSNKKSNIVEKNNFIQNKNFELFNKTANLYGFIIDKNQPWNLYFNSESEISFDYYSSYIVNNKPFFESFYIETRNIELFYFQKNIIDLYNKFATEKTISTRKIKLCKDKYYVDVKNYFLETLPNQVNNFLNFEYSKEIARLFTFTFLREHKCDIKQEQFNIIVTNFNKYLQDLDISSSMDYLHGIVNRSPKTDVKDKKYYF